jgi:hypothetical protein
MAHPSHAYNTSTPRSETKLLKTSWRTHLSSLKFDARHVRSDILTKLEIVIESCSVTEFIAILRIFPSLSDLVYGLKAVAEFTILRH